MNSGVPPNRRASNTLTEFALTQHARVIGTFIRTGTPNFGSRNRTTIMRHASNA